MHAPRPYGRFAGEAELASDDAAAVEQLARSLTNFKSASSLDSMKLVRELPSGRQAVAVDMGGVFRILILERYEDKTRYLDGLAQTNVPVLFSGAITRARLREGEGVQIKLTEQARRRIAGYKDDGLPPKTVDLQRFKVEYADSLTYFKPTNTGIFTFTQYDKLRPTWYSGAMAEVVQVIGGYGRQMLGELPDDPVERARIIVPERYMSKIREQLANVRLPGYSGMPDDEGQIKASYHARECNGVSFDAEGKPWLLRVSASGVYAMPMPTIPATTTPEFRVFMEDVADDEILTLLDRFGGMPSGEGFPEVAEDFEAWRRAGVIIKVCDTKDFYSKQAYFAACGWSFNSQGTEAFNTCWDYDPSGLKRGYAYKMKLALGAAKDQGKVGLSWAQDDPRTFEAMDYYLSRLYGQLRGGFAKSLAIKYKLRRATAQEILARSADNIQVEVDYWDALELEPIASHSVSISLVGEGPLYWGGKNPLSQGRLKFPELTGKGCESFSMISEDYAGDPVRCDTIVFGCYAGDSLQTIKYFLDERKYQREEQSSFEEYMIVGAWEKTVTSGLSGLMGNFYTSSFDDRQEAPPVVETTNLVGSDLGYGQPAYKTPNLLFATGGLSRARYYKHVTKVRITSGFSVDAAVCVPVYARDCILYAYQDSTTGTTESEWSSRGSVQDPTSYELWCYDNIFHYLGQTGNGNLGFPRSKEGTPVYVDTLNYLPTPVSDFADSGNWFNLPAGGTIDVTSVCGPYTSRASGNFQAGGVVIGGEAPGFEPYSKESSFPGSSSGRVSVSLGGAGQLVHRSKPHPWYFSFSPVDDFYFYQDATRVTIGSAGYASVYEKKPDGRRYSWGHTDLANSDVAQHFIGVINE